MSSISLLSLLTRSIGQTFLFPYPVPGKISKTLMIKDDLEQPFLKCLIMWLLPGSALRLIFILFWRVNAVSPTY